MNKHPLNQTIIWMKYGIEKLKKGINGINNIIETLIKSLINAIPYMVIHIYKWIQRFRKHTTLHETFIDKMYQILTIKNVTLA